MAASLDRSADTRPSIQKASGRGKDVEAAFPPGSALALHWRLRRDVEELVSRSRFKRRLFCDERRQLGLDRRVFSLGERASGELGAQFVDLIAYEHDLVSALMTSTRRERSRTRSRIAKRPAEPANGGANFVAFDKIGGTVRP